MTKVADVTWMDHSSRRAHLLVAILLTLFSLLLSRRLLGLLLWLLLLVTGVARQGLLQDLEDLLVLDFLVCLVLAQVQGRGSSQLGDTVLGDGFNTSRLAWIYGL